MDVTEPELILNNSQTCKHCRIHVKLGRVLSWDYGFCPRCYDGIENRKEPEIDPMNTVIRSATINPITLYLNKYTHFEMEKMK